MSKVSLDQQIAALEIVIVNRKGFVETLRELVAKKKRDAVEIEIAERPIAGLEAALSTLKWVKANESEIKKAFQRQGAA